MSTGKLQLRTLTEGATIVGGDLTYPSPEADQKRNVADRRSNERPGAGDRKRHRETEKAKNLVQVLFRASNRPSETPDVHKNSRNCLTQDSNKKRPRPDSIVTRRTDALEGRKRHQLRVVK